jgi:hypothetical protein
MPLPSPKDKEKRSEFMNRCMLDLAGKDEFKDNKQRAAVCFLSIKSSLSEASVVVGEEDTETILFF